MGQESLVGKLILINSGIGHLDDLSPRVRQYLQQETYFAVEDSRKFRDLLKRLEISLNGKVIESFHDHSSPKKLQKILAVLETQNVCVVSDAGSPVICDPAFPLVHLGLAQGHEVVTASGVSSILYSLELSGLPTHPFSFWGFLPRSRGKRTALIESLGRGTHIFFEAPHRLQATMEQFTTRYPKASFVLAKELSKTYQWIERFRGEEWPEVESTLDSRGEFVLLVYLEEGQSWDAKQLRSQAMEILQEGVKPKSLTKLLAHILGEDGKQIYKKLQNVDKRS